MDAANLLRPRLARGILSMMNATTLNKSRTLIEKDYILGRRFGLVIVDGPTVPKAFTTGKFLLLLPASAPSLTL